MRNRRAWAVAVVLAVVVLAVSLLFRAPLSVGEANRLIKTELRVGSDRAAVLHFISSHGWSPDQSQDRIVVEAGNRMVSLGVFTWIDMIFDFDKHNKLIGYWVERRYEYL